MLMRASAIFVAAMLVALPASAASVLNEPPAEPFKKVSTLVKFPSFAPGLGTLYVDPKCRKVRSSPMTTRGTWSAQSTWCC